MGESKTVTIKTERKCNSGVGLMGLANRQEGKRNNQGQLLDFCCEPLVGWWNHSEMWLTMEEYIWERKSRIFFWGMLRLRWLLDIHMEIPRRHFDISSWVQRRDPGWVYALGVICVLKAFKTMWVLLSRESSCKRRLPRQRVGQRKANINTFKRGGGICKWNYGRKTRSITSNSSPTDNRNISPSTHTAHGCPIRKSYLLSPWPLCS